VLTVGGLQAGDFSVLAAQSPFKIVSNGPAPTWGLLNVKTMTAFSPASNPKAAVTETKWSLDHN
jgi:hypothetical protein